MMKITSIEKGKKPNEKYSVYVDDKFAFSIPEEDFIELNLYEKSELTEEEIRSIREHVLFKAAKKTAIRFLSLKYRSENEVRKKLSREGFSKDITDRVVSELRSMGYINDQIYAQKYLYDRSKLKPKSKRMLKYELINKGVNENIIDSILDNWELDDRNLAISLVKKKFGKYDMNDEKIFRKAYAFLRHRGFDESIIFDVLKEFTKA